MSYMIINHITEYLPENVVTNEYFFNNYGITHEEIFAKSGIKERRVTSSDENSNTMAIAAVKKALGKLPYSIDEIDLIVGATYTPFDMVGTVAHAVQNYFNIGKAKCFTVDSACSSYINALEIVESFLTTGKASKALVVVSENNSIYNDFSDPKSGFLWGDGAAAVFISKERYSDNDFQVLDIHSKGLGNIGKSLEGVYLRPTNGGLKMPYGKDVFQFACKYLIEETENMLRKNNLSIHEIKYFIPHQANIRIIDFVADRLKINTERVLNNIEYLGNTGSASTAIIMAQNRNRFKAGDTIVISVFGGGYSSGAVLMNKL